jgi:rubrerythrin
MEYSEYEKGQQKPERRQKGPDNISRDWVSLDMAMRKENYSVQLYKALYDFVEREDARELLRRLIEEEKVHFNLLREVMLTGDYAKLGVPSEVKSLEMTDYLIKEEIRRSSKPEEIVKLAIRREEESEEFYLSRVNLIQDNNLKNLYQRFAQEEANHRKKLLRSYDDLIIMNIV